MESTILSPELRAAHLGISREDLAFREAAKDDPRLLDRRTFEPLRADLFEYPLQSWPTFLGAAKRDELHGANRGICGALKKIPERVFGDDWSAIARFYGIPSPAIAEVFFSEPNGMPAGLARGDFIHTADGFKCLEVNYSARIGGWETAPLVAAHLRIAPTAEFVRRHGIAAGCTDTIHGLFVHVIEQALAAGLAADGTLNVAIVREPGVPMGSAAFQAYLREEYAVTRRAMGGLDGGVRECYPDELASVGGAIHLAARRIDAVIEFNDSTPRDVYRAFKANRLVLWNGPLTRILSDKRNMALLSAGLEKGSFAAPEREAIRRHVPWTRQVLLGRADFYGEEMAMRDLLLSHREELVLKAGLSYGGKAVAIGDFTPAAAWREMVDAAFARGDWIVQERVESLPYLYRSGDSGGSPHDMIWGPFLFGETYGGLFLRLQPKADRTVVNLTQTATQGCAFEV
jgi:hypothetical protein